MSPEGAKKLISRGFFAKLPKRATAEEERRVPLLSDLGCFALLSIAQVGVDVTLTMFETKSNQVKALASTASGRGFLLASIAASYSCGTIRCARLSIAFRGVLFHKLEPLFVSGGDCHPSLCRCNDARP